MPRSQVMVSFGLQAKAWLEKQRLLLVGRSTWKIALQQNSEALLLLFETWDRDGDGRISKQEFRRGVNAMGLFAPLSEVDELFAAIDTDGDGTIEPMELVTAMPSLSKGQKGGSTDRSRRSGGSVQGELPTSDRSASRSEAVEADATLSAAPSGDEVRVRVSPSSPQVDDARPGGGPQAPTPPDAVPVTVAKRSTTTSTDSKSTHGRRASLQSRLTHLAEAVYLDHVSFSSKDDLQTIKHARERVKSFVREDLNKSSMWSFKTYRLFPILVRLRFLDHIFRWLFPIAYIVFVLVMFSEVDFGQTHEDALSQSPCREAAG